MCLINEHAKALKRLQELEDKLAAGDSLKPPAIPLLQLNPSVVYAEVQAKGLKFLYTGLLDGETYHYTTAEGWIEVISYIYPNMPKYAAGRMDCEDFAILMKGLVSSTFGLNYFALTIGNSPLGWHSFNFYRDEVGLMMLEPQKAEIMAWNEGGYTPEYVLL